MKNKLQYAICLITLLSSTLASAQDARLWLARDPNGATYQDDCDRPRRNNQRRPDYCNDSLDSRLQQWQNGNQQPQVYPQQPQSPQQPQLPQRPEGPSGQAPGNPQVQPQSPQTPGRPLSPAPLPPLQPQVLPLQPQAPQQPQVVPQQPPQTTPAPQVAPNGIAMQVPGSTAAPDERYPFCEWVTHLLESVPPTPGGTNNELRRVFDLNRNRMIVFENGAHQIFFTNNNFYYSKRIDGQTRVSELAVPRNQQDASQELIFDTIRGENLASSKFMVRRARAMLRIINVAGAADVNNLNSQEMMDCTSQDWSAFIMGGQRQRSNREAPTGGEPRVPETRRPTTDL